MTICVHSDSYRKYQIVSIWMRSKRAPILRITCVRVLISHSTVCCVYVVRRLVLSRSKRPHFRPNCTHSPNHLRTHFQFTVHRQNTLPFSMAFTFASSIVFYVDNASLCSRVYVWRLCKRRRNKKWIRMKWGLEIDNRIDFWLVASERIFLRELLAENRPESPAMWMFNENHPNFLFGRCRQTDRNRE